MRASAMFLPGKGLQVAPGPLQAAETSLAWSIKTHHLAHPSGLGWTGALPLRKQLQYFVGLCVDPVDLCIDPVDLRLDPVDLCVDPVDLCVDPVDLSLDPVDLRLELGSGLSVFAFGVGTGGLSKK
jgi:hypothetical protein